MQQKNTFNSQQYSNNNFNQLNPNITNQIHQAQPKHQVREQTYRYKHTTRERAIRFIGFAVIAFFIFQLGSQTIKLYHTSSSLNKTNEQLVNSIKTNKDLKNEQEKLNDSDYLEQVLRDKYQYTKDGETIYNLPDKAE